MVCVFFFKQKTAYEMRISDWSSDVCSSDLIALRAVGARWGLPAAGFFAGFASSTAAVAGFGGRVREQPGVLVPAVAAALLSNLASQIGRASCRERVCQYV